MLIEINDLILFIVVHFDNKKKKILVLFDGPKQGLDNAAIKAGANNYINFSRSRKTFPYIYIIMEATGFYLLIPQKYINSKHTTLKQNPIHCN